MAQSGLARLTGGQKVAGSNPVAPTLFLTCLPRQVFCWSFLERAMRICNVIATVIGRLNLLAF